MSAPAPTADPVYGANQETEDINACPTPLPRFPNSTQTLVRSVQQALARTDRDGLTQFVHADPVLSRSKVNHFRSYAVAFVHTDIDALGGIETLSEMLLEWKTGGTWDLCRATFQNKKFIKVVFTTITDANVFFLKTLALHLEAWCQRPLSSQWCPTRSPPLPTLWKGGLADAGYRPEELLGLVTWKFFQPQEQAAETVLRRILTRLECEPQHLGLFVDPQWIFEPGAAIAGRHVTIVKVVAHNGFTASRIARGSDGNLDKEVQMATSLKGCGICRETSHAAWSCTSPKIRIRLSGPFNITIKTHLRSLLAASNGAVPGLLNIWGGRSPKQQQQNKRFGYLAFTDADLRDNALKILTSTHLPCVVPPLCRVDGPMWTECPSCGCSQQEPTSYQVRVHNTLTLHQRCPNLPPSRDRAFGCDMDIQDWRSQFPPPGLQGARC